MPHSSSASAWAWHALPAAVSAQTTRSSTPTAHQTLALTPKPCSHRRCSFFVGWFPPPSCSCFFCLLFCFPPPENFPPPKLLSQSPPPLQFSALLTSAGVVPADVLKKVFNSEAMTRDDTAEKFIAAYFQAWLRNDTINSLIAAFKRAGLDTRLEVRVCLCLCLSVCVCVCLYALPPPLVLSTALSPPSPPVVRRSGCPAAKPTLVTRHVCAQKSVATSPAAIAQHTQTQTGTHTHTDTRKHKHFGFLCLTLLCRPKGLEAQVGAPLYRGRSHECIKT